MNAADIAEIKMALLVEIKTALLAGKVRPEKVSTEWAYQRAWNDGIDWSIMRAEKLVKGDAE